MRVVVEVGTTRRLTIGKNDNEADEDDGHVNADDMRSRTIAHAATVRTSLRMGPSCCVPAFGEGLGCVDGSETIWRL